MYNQHIVRVCQHIATLCNIVVSIVVCVLAVVPMRGLANQKQNDNSSEREMFHNIKDKIVIVEGNKGCGSGFIATAQDGVKYFYTNKHVVEGQREIKARLLDGREVELGDFQYAEDIDIVRFAVNDTYAALEFDLTMPMIGDEIVMFGNSAGAGVATKITGKVLGVGPSSVEVSARFVPGNSGSAILNKEGKVVAVATYVALFALSDDWRFSGTRFTDVRRFGIRIYDAKWKSCGFSDFNDKMADDALRNKINKENNDTRALLQYLNERLARYMSKATRIYTAQEVLDNVKKTRSAGLKFRDVWDREFHFEIVTNRAILTSSGADKVFGTYDDLSITNFCAFSKELLVAEGERLAYEEHMEKMAILRQQLLVSNSIGEKIQNCIGFSLDCMYDICAFECDVYKRNNVEFIIASGKTDGVRLFDDVIFNNYSVYFTAQSATAFFIELKTVQPKHDAIFYNVVKQLEGWCNEKMVVTTNLLDGVNMARFDFPNGRKICISQDPKGLLYLSYSNDAIVNQVACGFESLNVEALQAVDSFLGMPIGSSFEPVIPSLRRPNKYKKSVSAEFAPKNRFMDFQYYELRFSRHDGRIGMVTCWKIVRKSPVLTKHLYHIMAILEQKYKRRFHLARRYNVGGMAWEMQFPTRRKSNEEDGVMEYEVESVLSLSVVPSSDVQGEVVVVLGMAKPNIVRSFIDDEERKEADALLDLL